MNTHTVYSSISFVILTLNVINMQRSATTCPNLPASLAVELSGSHYELM